MAAEPDELTWGDLSGRTYRALVEAAPDIVIVFDRDGYIRFVNSAVTRILGYEPEELTGRVLFDYFHPEDLEQARERVRSILSADAAMARRMLYRLRGQDGAYRHLETLALNRVDDQDIDGIFAIARDVTAAGPEGESAAGHRGAARARGEDRAHRRLGVEPRDGRPRG